MYAYHKQNKILTIPYSLTYTNLLLLILSAYIENSIVAKDFDLPDVVEEFIGDQFNEAAENSRNDMLRHGIHFRVDDDKIKEDFLDVAAHCRRRWTLLPVKAASLNALLYDANY